MISRQINYFFSVILCSLQVILSCDLLNSQEIYEPLNLSYDSNTNAPILIPTTKSLQFSHIESKGLGYRQGYTTAEAFFGSESQFDNSSQQFIDVRGHLFDDGKWAANAGIGVRFIRERIWGANFFYDYRNTNHCNFNQLGIGFESLGCVYDVRFNAYFPVGRQKSHTYHNHFERFVGNHALLSKKNELAMRGFDAELGGHILSCDTFSLYAAAGPYYYRHAHRQTTGGKARANLKYRDNISVEISGSYDHLFKGIIQGTLSVNVPFGDLTCSCADSNLISALNCPVERQEIIVVNRRKQTSFARDPNTLQPISFWFVDNTSHSTGTIESPFPTLREAQNISKANDIIFVFAGDGTSNGMDEGIILKNNQRLLGASFDHQLATSQGTYVIPAQGTSRPLITNLANAPVITLSNHNEVSGFNIQSGIKPGISGINVQNATINFNDFSTANLATLTTSINLVGSNANVSASIKNNTFVNGGINIQNSGSGRSNVEMINNQLTINTSANLSTFNLIKIDAKGNQSNTSLFSNYLESVGQNNNGSKALVAASLQASQNMLTIENNQFKPFKTQPALTIDGGYFSATQIEYNAIYGNVLYSGLINGLNISNLGLTVENNCLDGSLILSGELPFSSQIQNNPRCEP